MAQAPVEMILLKQWASYVSTPVWLADPEGNLVFYNEPAEPILGEKFDDAGAISADQLAELFVVSDLDGRPLQSQDLPLVIALNERVPSHRAVSLQGLDGTSRTIEVTALPLVGQGNRFLGALATFWELT